MRLKFRKYSWQLVPSSVKDIRQTVFIDEQSVPPQLEWDETDEIADHFLAVLPDNTPVGVARIFGTLDETAHIGRMAILKPHRGKGFGKQLLEHLCREVASSFQEIELSAQHYAVPFYQRLGFHVCSEPYDDAGIAHVDMRCLASELCLEQEKPRPTPMILDSDGDSWLFDQGTDHIALLDSLAGQARQRMWLYDQHLHHEIYGRRRFEHLVSGLARRHRQSEVRLLIHDDKPLVKRRHRLVELMRRLPSSIELRLVNEDYPLRENPFVLIDRCGLLYQNDFSLPSGFANFADGGRVKMLGEEFQRMWDVARPSIELRELPL